MPSTALRSGTPRIDPEFQNLIAPLSSDEYRQLEASLASEGCRDALVTWRNTLLDGHTRIEICTRLKLRYRTIEVDLPNREAAKLWIEENQIGRRNLSPDQRAALAHRILQRRVALSKRERGRKGGLRLVDTASTKKAREREQTAAQVGVATRKVRLVGELAKHDPTIVERIASGQLSLIDANIEVRERVRNQYRKEALREHSSGQQIHTGDYTKLWDLVEDNSTDLFLSDPVYSDIDQYRGLAELAKAKLKPGGSCVVCLGAYHLPEVLNAMTSHLDYVWLISVKHGQPFGRVWSKKVWQRFAPVLVFKKPCGKTKKPSHDWFCDLLETKELDHLQVKQNHVWGKSQSNFCYFVERFSSAGGLVVDPFVGGGTTALACKLTGRRFIGTEIDPGVSAAARATVVKVGQE